MSDAERRETQDSFGILDFARAVQEMARSARAHGLLMPGVRTRPGQSGIDVWPGGSTITIPREHSLDAMKRTLADGVLAANTIDGASEAGAFHRHHLLDAVGVIGRHSAGGER